MKNITKNDDYFGIIYCIEQMFDILLANRYLKSGDALNCRFVSKLWRQSVDVHYNSADIHSIAFRNTKKYRYPRASFTVPLDETVCAKFAQFAGHGRNPFLGSRLLIKIDNPEGNILGKMPAECVVYDEKMKHVWEYIEHLEVLEEDKLGDGRNAWISGRDGLVEILQPFFRVLKNVKTVVFEVGTLGAEELLILPHLDKLEQLILPVESDEDMTDYQQLLSFCHSSLKLLLSNGYLSAAMGDCVKTFKFDKLKELSFPGPYNTMLKYRKHAEIAFVNLKFLGLEFIPHDAFYTQLVDITCVCSSLEEIVINCRAGMYDIPKFNLPAGISARNGLKKVTIFEESRFDQHRFECIVENLRKVFPKVKHFSSVKLGRHELGVGECSIV